MCIMSSQQILAPLASLTRILFADASPQEKSRPPMPIIAPNKPPYCHIKCKPYTLLYWKQDIIYYSDVLLNICGEIKKRSAENINEQIQIYFHPSAFIFHLLQTSRRLGLWSSVRSVVLEMYLQEVRVDAKLTLPNLSESCTVLCQLWLLL
jgi:hypothetical protein